VTSFFEPVLDGHDRTQVEVTGYGNVACPDEITARLRTKFDRSRDIRGLTVAEAAARIEQDRIDVLVEVGGHVTGNRLDVLALQPAPVQVDFGGLSTTGLSSIQYRITDRIYDPPSPRRRYGERCMYLPGGLSCFRPYEGSPAVGPLPARTHGFVTFGSFNNLAKISPLILTQWIRILKVLPQSRLLLKLNAAKCPAIRERLVRAFTDQGIAPERILFQGWGTYAEHLQCFNRVDLLLDTYPYNGGITTLEGLWMAVPAVTLMGETFVSRAGASILSRVGLDVFVAQNPDEYVAKALAFAGQIDDLATIRAGLRERFLHSPLCDAGRMARELEAAYRRMWRNWCDSETVRRFDGLTV
jgi:predicted O-linked N-acetylglucosamine transferase (SPINDLY family)